MPRFQVLLFSADSKAQLSEDIRALANGLTEDNFQRKCVENRKNVSQTSKFRYSLMCQSAEETKEKLRKVEEEEFLEWSPLTADNVSFFFIPQGPHHQHMEEDLFEEAEVFTKTIDFMTKEISSRTGHDFRNEMYPADRSHPDDALYTANFSSLTLLTICTAIRKQLNAWGIHSNFCGTWSIGEVNAAVYADRLTETEAISFLIRRAALFHLCPPVNLVVVLDDYPSPPDLYVTGMMSYRGKAVAGDKEKVEKYKSELIANNVRYLIRNSPHAFHSPLMEPMFEGYRKVVEETEFKPGNPEITIISSLNGKPLEELSPDYWVAQMGNAYRTDLVIQATKANPKLKIVMPIGPLRDFPQYLADAECNHLTLIKTAGERKEKSPGRIFEAAGQLWANGYSVDFTRVYPQ